LLRGILGGVGTGFDPAVLERSDDQIATDTVADLKEVAGLSREPDFVRVWRHPAGIPQYRPGHRELTGMVDAGLRRRPGLHLLGHTLRGVGVNEGIRAASALVRRLSSGIPETFG
jgi:oxygen-dependent protoporphyrinogen oxidase